MAKEESGRLFSKVAKFVRNPLKDWSELDAQDSTGADASGYSRDALKEMIERRQRNDFVRRREFDMLRRLRQREVAGVKDPAATPSSFNGSSTADKSDGRAITLQKIDEIEEQMSQQWWKGRGAKDGGREGAAGGTANPLIGGEVPQGGAQARAGAPDSTLHGTVGGLDPSRLQYESPLEEASIRFAQNDDTGSEAILLQALSPENAQADHDETWLGLLDLYRAMGNAEKFVAASTRYTQRFKRQAPEWISLRSLARERHATVSNLAGTEPGSPVSGVDWSCPSRLGRESLSDLTRALAAANGPTWTLDWRALASIAPDAAPPLTALFAHWSGAPVQLKFLGSAQLRQVLEVATPSNERSVNVIWWQLRMEALRLMHEADDFELAALNYCITYEVSPPPWEDPKGEYVAIETSPTVTSGASRSTFAGMSDEAQPAVDAGYPELIGELSGDSVAAWQRLDAGLADSDASFISCAALLRIDFGAAVSLLAWVTERDGRGQRVQFVDAHRLVVTFLKVVGVGEHAAISARTS
jgi:ABC-type transporter Mla MlaB component